MDFQRTTRPRLRTALLGLLILLVLTGCRQEQPNPVVLENYRGPVPEGARSRLGRSVLNLVTYSHDGAFVAAASRVGLTLHDAANLDEIWSLASPSSVVSLAFAPGGDLIAAGLEDGVLLLVDAATGLVINASGDHQGSENSLYALAWAASPVASGSRLLAAGFSDGNVLVSRISGQGPDSQSAVVGALERHRSGVSVLTYSPNGRILASGSRAGVINLWDSQDLSWVGALQGHELSYAILSLAWSPDGRSLLSGSRDDRVILWDVTTFVPTHTVARYQADTVSVSYGPDGRRFATASADGDVSVSEADAPETVIVTQHDTDALSGVAWAPDWQSYAGVSSAGQLGLWPLAEEVAGGQAAHILSGYSLPPQQVGAVAWSPDGVLATGLGRQVLVWDDAQTTPVRRLEGHEELVTSLAWSPDGDRLATGSRDGRIIIWDGQSDEELLTLVGHADSVPDLAWSPDGRWLASAGALDDTVIVWDGASGEIWRRWSAASGGAWSVAWSPDGRQLVAGTTDGRVLFWHVDDAQAAEPFKQLGRHLNWVSRVVWLADGRLLSAGADNRIVLTDLDTDSAVAFGGHSAPVRDLTISPEGTRFASAGRDNLVIVRALDGESGASPIVLQGHTSGVNSVSWAPDGQGLASGSDDGTVILWSSVP